MDVASRSAGPDVAPTIPDEPQKTARFRPSGYLVLSALAVAGAAALSVRQPWGADFGLHVAVLGRLRDNLWSPANPMVDADSPSPYFTPYPLLLAIVARITGLGAATVLSAAAPVNLALLLYGLRRFTARFSDDRWAAVLALLFVPLLWGPAVPQWSGFPALRSLVLILPYPSTIALAMTLLFWALLAEALDNPVWWRWTVLGPLAGVITLVHPFTAVCAAIGALALLVARLTVLDRRRLLGLLLAAGLAAAVTLGWPYFRVTDLLAAAGGLNAIHEALYEGPLRRYGLALVGLPALALRLRRDRRDPLVLLFVISGAAALVGGLSGAFALGRVIPIVVLSLQVAAAVELARALRAYRTGRAAALTRSWAAVAAAACALGLFFQYGNLLLALPPDQLTPARKQAHQVTSLPDYGWIGHAVNRGDVVAVDSPSVGRALLRYEVRFVAPPWPDPMLADERQRSTDLNELLAPGTPEPRRQELIRRYRVSWILDPRGEYTWADPLSDRIIEPRKPARLLHIPAG